MQGGFQGLRNAARHVGFPQRQHTRALLVQLAPKITPKVLVREDRDGPWRN